MGLIRHTSVALAVIAAGPCADELCLTGNARRNRAIEVAFQAAPPAAAQLFDGALHDRKSLAMRRDGMVRVTFAEPVVVSRVVLSYYNDPKRSYNAARDAVVHLWQGDAPVGEPVALPIDGDPQLRIDTDDQLVWAGRAEARLAADSPVTSVTVDVHKMPGAHQALIRELQVWGMPVRMAAVGWRPLQATVSDNTCASLRVQWDAVPEGTQYVRVRVRKRGMAEWRPSCFASSPGLVPGLTPGSEYEVAVDACVGSGSDDESTAAVHRVRLPGPLEVRTVGDVLGMNFFPGGGGAHQKREDERGMTLRMCKLMQEAGVRHARWWLPSPGGAALFAEHGMLLLANVGSTTTPEQLTRFAEESGLFVHDTANEPDFHSVFPEDYVAALRRMRAAADAASHRIALIGPTFGGELFGPGADYLDACYRAGMKGLLDALDLHPYAKYCTPTPRGGRTGGPEGVLDSLGCAREVLARYGEAELPITVSECGHPTFEGTWFMPPISFEQQAQCVVRTHLLLIGADVRRIWYYAFQDEGTDRTEPEHNFGIVDWHGEPKPAYHAYRAMATLLGHTTSEGLQSDAEPPVYAARFRDGKAYVTALWDSAGESEVVVAAEGGIAAAFDLFGRQVPDLVTAVDRQTVRATESVVYLRSSSPLRLVSQRRLEPPIRPHVQLTLDPSTVALARAETASWRCRLRSEFDVPVEVRLSFPGPWNRRRNETSVTLAPNGAVDVPMHLTAPADAKERIISWDVKCEFRKADTDQAWRVFRRAIFFQVRGG